MKRFACALAYALIGCSGNTTAPTPQMQSKYELTVRLADIGKTCTAESPAFALTGARLDSVPNARRGGSDGLWYDAARELPGGIGGIFLDHGNYYVWLVDTTKKAEAFAGLAAKGFGGLFPFDKAVALKARWDFAQLSEWFAYVVPRALEGENVRSLDIQEAHNRLEFGVADENARRAVEAKLKGLDIPCNLVALFLQDPIGFSR